MKRNCLFVLLLAGVIAMFFIACKNPTDSGVDGNDPVSISNSSWADGLNPETTLQFMIDQVTLGGGSSAVTGNKNWYWGAMDGQTYPFDVVEDTDAILALLDQVEDFWGSNFEVLPDAVIVVWTDFAKKIGFQLHYYDAGTGKNYERFICWGVGQPHEFIRQ
ncbi:MAG: hypothetical protein LBS57_13730 [Treponema sp.]|jgi:hypothetical protein|nr:hypothetical protein [Treponema sp.]